VWAARPRDGADNVYCSSWPAWRPHNQIVVDRGENRHEGIAKQVDKLCNSPCLANDVGLQLDR
jgi:hypothetical protein